MCVWGGEGRILSAGVGVRHRKNPINGSWGRSGGWGLSLIFRVSGVFHWSLLEIRHAPPPRQHNTLQSGVGFHLFYHLLYIYICVCVSVCVCVCVCVCVVAPLRELKDSKDRRYKGRVRRRRSRRRRRKRRKNKKMDYHFSFCFSSPLFLSCFSLSLSLFVSFF